MSCYTRKNKKGEDVWFVDFQWKSQDGSIHRIRKPAKDPYQKPAKSRTAAEQYEQRLRAQLIAGVGPDIPKTLTAPEEDKGSKLNDFYQKYQKQYVSRNKPSSKDATNTIFKNHILPNLGNKHLDEIGEADFAKLATSLRSKGKKPKTINNILSSLRTCLTVANSWGARKALPPKINWERKIDVIIEHFTECEIERFVQLQDPMITVAVKTGLRLGELLALRWTDIQNNRIIVSRSVWWKNGKPYDGATKTNRIRVVPLPQSAIEALQNIGRLSDFVFTGPDGERLTKNGVKRRLWNACKALDLEPCGWHKLRHSYVSSLVVKGAPLPTVQKLAGHSTIQMTMRYTHIHNDDLMSAINKLS